jgi:phenylpropionate dioxygenase-like ring-hydroxylating dioxygenase large terminal subunit
VLDDLICGRAASELFDGDAGVINPTIYADRRIYEQELERVFARSWLFIAHEKDIPKTGDGLLRHLYG